MKESKIEKQQRKLLELGVMEKEDTLIDFFQASYVERLIEYEVDYGEAADGPILQRDG